MNVLVLLSLLLVGLVAGLASGLVGIGGGVLIVPFLYFFYGHAGWSGTTIPWDLHTIVAHATSLFVMVPTAIRGARSYHKSGLVLWRVAVPVALTSAVATIAGTWLAEVLPGATVRIGFGIFLLFTGAQLVWRPHQVAPRPMRLTAAAVISTGVMVGLLSGLLGIGGGAIASAMMIQLIGLDLKQAAATSLAIIAFAATVGTLTWFIRGWDVPGMPLASIGYVHVAAAVPIMIGSILTVKLGTRVNQQMSDRKLKHVFAAFFTLLGLYLIGQNVLEF